MNTQKTLKQTTCLTFSSNPQTFLEISKAAFDHNIAYYRNLIGAHNILAVVIKSNGYGHGLNQMAYLCEQNKHIGWLCVANLSQALAITNTSKPILILGYSDLNPAQAIDKNIHFMVEDLEYAHLLNAIGKNHNYRFNVHLKIDTGLSRLGVLPCNTLELIQQIQSLDNLFIAGIFSHFAASNDNPEFTQHQFCQFNNVLTLLNKQSIAIKYIHMSNSAAIGTLEYPTQFNFFRLGLGAYGFGDYASHLQPVMTWKTHIVSIKTIPANSFVSYACTYKTTRPTRIAILPMGYGDGYDFRFGNNAQVIINGSYAPVIGRIAMNMTIIDVTDITAQTNDEVLLVGNHSDIHAQNLTNHVGILNVREFLTGINSALTRIIVE